MIVGEQKPIAEIKDKVSSYSRLLILGCGTCVKTCFAGGEYGVATLYVSEKTGADGSTLGNTNIKNRDVTILAIEKADKALPFPGPEVSLVSRDCLLCYGKLTDLMNMRL